MNYRYADILAEEDVSADKTFTVDLGIQDIISRLDIRYKFTASVHGMANYGYSDITKIEIVDGSDVLHSLKGSQNQALCMYNRDMKPMTHGQHMSGLSDVQFFGVDFGRYLWDREYGFDASKFVNPQLKITVNWQTVDTGATSGKLEVLGHLFDERVVAPRGFMMAKEHYEYTCGDENSYEYVELPQDYNIRRLLIQAYRSAYEPWAQLKELKIDEDNEKRIPLDIEIEKFHRLLKMTQKPIEEPMYVYPESGGTTYYVSPTDYWDLPIGNFSGARAAADFGAYRGGQITFPAEAMGHFVGFARGWAPNHCINIPVCDVNEPSDYYNPGKYKKVRVRMKAGSSGTSGSNRVILEQMRPY